MSCNILFIRHGQSLGNMAHLFLGHTNLDLSPQGFAQAQKTASFLMERSIDKIYSSDLRRAYNTSSPLCTLKGMKAEKNKNLRELFAGKWENRLVSDLKKEFSSYSLWLSNIGRAIPDGGESVIAVQKRFYAEIKKIAEENEGKTVVVFTHATPIRTFFALIQGRGIDEIKELPWPSNASLSEAVYENGEFKCICYSRDDYLEDIATPMQKGV